MNGVTPKGNVPAVFIDAKSISTVVFEDGDTVVVTVPKSCSVEQGLVQAVANQLSTILNRQGVTVSAIIMLQEGVSLSTLDEKEMAEVGWVRKKEEGEDDNGT